MTSSASDSSYGLHIVPLRRSWNAGAWEWTSLQRQIFANDPAELLAVSARANEAKHDAGPRRVLPGGRSIDAEAFNELASTGNLLRDTPTVLAAAAWWARRRLGTVEPVWTLIGFYTRGRLLAPPG